MRERREEIMDAAVKLFAHKGYYNTKIADIVNLVGIAKGTFYLYFKSKKELFLSLIKKQRTLIDQGIDIKNIVEESNDLKSFVKILVREAFKIYGSNKDLTIVILRESVSVNEDFVGEFKIMDKERTKRLKSAYSYLKEEGYIELDNDFEFFYYVFVGIIESILLRKLIMNEEEFISEEVINKTSNYIEKALSI
ncbi:TetR/AcrR family transcriptional regulator [Halanaerobium hydrogeniformans]|uniref:Transcriptional regulator, TetR family n=1 Tax=Halanaerobium hydrogeniformans TaxID=656519 RepID=E4RJM6_HALHG|nr:TetR/AcrR family transcriptional regulator [Halanaerobium hydrogeniformans]ADQ15446.1 transcriptional regulator, TetR family [Halanaerobium hydrogeniformans]